MSLARLIEAAPDELGTLRNQPQLWDRLQIMAIYESNVEREKEEVALIRKDEATKIPENIDYSS